MTCGQFSVGKGVLLPVDDGAREMCRKPGELLDVEAQFERDMHYHRHVFAQIADLAKAVGQTPEWMRAQLLVYAGLFRVVGLLDGKMVVAVNSMSRHSMRDDELHAFWDDAKAHIIERVLPKIPNENLRERLAHNVTAF